MTPDEWAKAINREIIEAQEEGVKFTICYDCESSCCVSFRIQAVSNPDGIILWSTERD